MNKKIKIIILAIVFIAILFIAKDVKAKDYSIDEIDIQGTVNTDGSLSVEETIRYSFDGQYNGIYITIPHSTVDLEDSDIVINSKLNDALYEGNSIDVQSVKIISNGTEQEINNKAYAGTNRYEVDNNIDMTKITVYSRSENETKSFKINYVINNLCVKHNDIGELYYNFIGGEWEKEIKKVNIDILLPNNNSTIEVWGHGPYNGESKIIGTKRANFNVSNVKKGQYVAARVLFDNSNIPDSTKLSNIDAKPIIYADENAIIENKEQKEIFTIVVILVAIILLIYWIILMLIYERDKKYIVTNINEEELFNKYNPMIAGCIQGSREILARDIIAVILNLIDKKNIKLDVLQKLGKENYTYVIEKNQELENNMDKVEKYVYNWVFEKNDKVTLEDRLKEMPKEEKANTKFKELNNLAKEKLSEIGANQGKVPLGIRIFNVILFILSLILIIRHIMFNGFNAYGYSFIKQNVLLIVYLIPLIPLGLSIIYIPINLIIIIRHKINKTVQKITGQKVATTTISLIVLFGVIIALTAIFSPVKYIIADEILLCIATILILTDNLMLKNSVIMIEDYSKLNTLKNKIENYTMMEDKDIEHIVLWEKYLSYAVSFGIADKITKRIKGLNLDEDLTRILEDAALLNFITTDYYYFYTYASLDRRFIRNYKNTISKSKFLSGGGFSSGGGGGFSGGG